MEVLTGTYRIDVTKIAHHPDNPRKELGDLSELSESIYKTGLLQDITVIPTMCLDAPKEEQADKALMRDGPFYILMGHRRFSAFCKAFEDKEGAIPPISCKIAYGLSRAEQIGIMLEENVQRNELTIPEQIESFQLMLDLGETIETVSEKTGFSRSTIYKRIKNADIVEALKDKTDYQLSIADLDELAKVDPEDKEKVLEGCTSHIAVKQRVKEWEEKKARRKFFEGVIEELEKLGVLPYDEDAQEIYPRWWQLTPVCTIRYGEEYDLSEITGEEYYEVPNQYTYSIFIIRPRGEQEEESEEEDEEERQYRERKENKKKLEEIFTALRDSMGSFVRDAVKGEFKLEENLKVDDVEWWLMQDVDNHLSSESVTAIFYGKSTWEISEDDLRALDKEYAPSIIMIFLAELHRNMAKPFNWRNEYQESVSLDVRQTMSLFRRAGWSCPDIEGLKEMLDGTSELYSED